MESRCGHYPISMVVKRVLWVLLCWSDYGDVVCFNLNKLNPDLYSSRRTSGFGFSVTQFAINESKWLIIGAPFDRGETTPDGAVYKCAEKQCQRMRFNLYGSKRTNSSYSMIGASVTASHKDGFVVACAPRYSYYEEPFFSDEDEAIYMMGACFVYNGKDNTYRTKPYTPCMPGTNGILAINKQCAAGFSVSVMEGEDAFVVGALGTNYYRGQYIRMEISRRRYPDYGLTGLHEGDYSGYGVATGKFSGGMVIDIVAGAPRGNDHFGKVTLYRRLIGKGWQQLLAVSGRQFGEYFGSVLAVGDLNGDKLDDLVVGAPYHANLEERIHEVGKVYVFYQEQLDIRKTIFSDHVTELQGDVTRSGRFGFAVAVISDIDQDGYNDLAVGAPLEGLAGAIYVFLGSPLGVASRPAQVIRGSEYGTLNMRMFGSALSGTLDMDGNGYPDLLVGASGSGHCLLLKTHPVMRVDVELATDITYIKLDDLKCDVMLPPSAISCFHLNTIIKYGGKSVQKIQFLRISLVLNPDNSTGKVILFVEDHLRQKSTNLTETFPLIKHTLHKREYVVFITNAIVEYIPPITIQLNYGLNQPDNVSQPVLDAKVPASKTTTIQVYRPPADLNISVTSMNLAAVLGKGQQTEFRVKVNNMKEVPCYNAEINISLPPGISYASIDGPKSVTCLMPKEQPKTLICSLGFRFSPKTEVEFYLRTSINNQSLLFHMTSLTYLFNLSSVNDVDPSNDLELVTLNLTSDIDLVISGTSSPDQLQVTEDSEAQNVTHSYKFTNHGLSLLVAMEVWITWPVMTSNGIPLLILDEGPVVSDNKGRCLTDERGSAPLTLSQLEVCNPVAPSLYCKKIHCVIKAVDGGESVTIELASTLSANVIKYSEVDNSLLLNSTVKAVGEPVHGIPMSGTATDHLTLGFFRRGIREQLYSAKRQSNNLNWANDDDEEDDGAIYPLTERLGDAAEDVDKDNDPDTNRSMENDDKLMNDFDDRLQKPNDA
ncbi:hypothetical protein LSH36_66g07012 [Paralvinella palmiformis]|uniref:Integrin alpha-2 domain-containing protein n=1 Tax=Paralvinella palmiformis TaxID=53620 RepID=A0AAD9K3P8_9ANNE|nr:hypothetical protein LSH36_66g07012 [Paralvinella palmiformis]